MTKYQILFKIFTPNPGMWYWKIFEQLSHVLFIVHSLVPQFKNSIALFPHYTKCI